MLFNNQRKFIIWIFILSSSFLFGDESAHDNLKVEENISFDIFNDQLQEAKLIFSDAIILDSIGDTLNANYNFVVLFEILESINLENVNDFQKIEFNQLLMASIDYFENKAITSNNPNNTLSVALFKDKLNDYIYSQTLEDLEFVDETVEVIPGHLPITYNNKVANIINFFKGQGRDTFQKWIHRVSVFKPIILPILEEEGVPPELFYVAMIESGLNPKAYSYAHASGMWQFIASTGKIYGMEKNWWVDERRDFIKSTYAAARYFKDLYKRFGDWYLALAAYNCGSNRVRKAIKRDGSKNYWDLHSLPLQTRNYVPNVMAAIFIDKNPIKYGFSHSQNSSKMEWHEISIDKSVTLDVISKCSNVDIEVLKKYNPKIRRDRIPPLKSNESFSFRMPLTCNNDFDSLFALVEEDKIDEIIFKEHKVKHGESLWLIARKYNVRIADIRMVNKVLKNKKHIYPGQKLVIPIGNNDSTKKNKMKNNYIFHKIKRNETLSHIAMKYKTSVRKIKKWNGLRSNKIKYGAKLKIYIN